MKKFLPFLSFAAIIFFASCKGYSKYPISEKGTVKVNEDMFGIWKAVGDTNASNYILVQSTDDAHYYLSEIRRDYGSLQRWNEHLDSSVSTRTGTYVPHVIDTVRDITWMLEEEKKNEAIKDLTYWVTWFDRSGKNPHYQQWSMREDIVAGQRFITSDYWRLIGNSDKRETGYVIFRLLKASKDSFTVCVIDDRAMKDLGSSAAVRERIEKNIDNKDFYGNTVQFYKVKGGHFGLNRSMEVANK